MNAGQPKVMLYIWLVFAAGSLMREEEGVVDITTTYTGFQRDSERERDCERESSV